MTVKELNELIKKYNIPEDAKLESDSGWECDPTGCDTVFYNANTNTLLFTQKFITRGEFIGYGSVFLGSLFGERGKSSYHGQNKSDWKELI